MNYNWDRNLEVGQKGIGFVEIHNTNANGFNLLVILNYLPLFLNETELHNVHATLFIQAEQENLTDGLMHNIFDDICEIVQSEPPRDSLREEKGSNLIITQTFLVEVIPDFRYLTHGDYTSI